MVEKQVVRSLRRHAPEGPRPEVRERLMAEAASRLGTELRQGTAAPRARAAPRWGLVWAVVGLLLCANWGVNAYYNARVGRLFRPAAAMPAIVTDADRLAKDFGEPLIAKTPSALLMRVAAARVVPPVCVDDSGLQDSVGWCIVGGRG